MQKLVDCTMTACFILDLKTSATHHRQNDCIPLEQHEFMNSMQHMNNQFICTHTTAVSTCNDMAHIASIGALCSIFDLF